MHALATGLLTLVVLAVLFSPATFGSLGPPALFGAIVVYAMLSSPKLPVWDRFKQAIPGALGVVTVYRSTTLADDKRFDEATYTLLSGALVTVVLWYMIGRPSAKVE